MAGRGRLLVVGTPIGNLGDLTPRAAEALRTADLVVAEDTRLAARLLAHLGVRRPTIAFNEHAPEGRLAELLARLAGGSHAGADDRRRHAGGERPRRPAGGGGAGRRGPRWRSCPGRRP